MVTLTKKYLWNAAVIAVAAWVGLTFGYELAHYRAVGEALAELETCQKHADCVQALERLVAAKGGR